ncbi:lytic murein transglycosylase [Sutterella massiliensis]|uniref:Lytic murein transglycosylase n=1 Tax=Sutterella massiliensis TaxID=1816689 RepID=A0ABS2DUC9_9BURK|nr:lytic murein transglycosylase [Sutterella massiliensis]MBM6704957.1 lytic murein transglycosylase [Sutterella massiliensis]
MHTAPFALFSRRPYTPTTRAAPLESARAASSVRRFAPVPTLVALFVLAAAPDLRAQAPQSFVTTTLTSYAALEPTAVDPAAVLRVADVSNAAEASAGAQGATTETSLAKPQTAAEKHPAKTTKPEEAKKRSKSAKNTTVSDYVERAEVQAYLRSVSEEKGIPYEWLEREVALARYSPLSEKYTTPKPKADKKRTPDKNFILYERNLVNAERIDRGIDFMERNLETLRRVEKDTGVSGYAVTAIIGVESIYGRNMGRFRVLDALMTLSFDYTRRANYYRSELSSFLDFCYRQDVAPVSVTGSFAGALGLGQFMPASLNAYGRDGDGDGKIDIVKNEADGIASVANFLLEHGWPRGKRPLYPVNATEAIFKATNSGGIHTNATVASLLAAGVTPVGALPLAPDEKAMLVNLPWIAKDNTRGVDYYIGTDAFSAILRYNRSYFYAAAVTLLAYELEEQSKGIMREPPAEASGQTAAAPSGGTVAKP